MRVLLTGFEPFGGEQINPSWLAVQGVSALVPHLDIVCHQLPTVFGAALEELRVAIEDHNPRVVICTGQAGGRPCISLERVAINLMDARIPDNAGQQPLDEPIFEGAPAAYFTTLPVKRLRQRMIQEGIPSEISYTAGTFVCNDVFYGLMHDLSTRSPGIIGGFVHVPYLPEQVAARTWEPSMSLSNITRALAILAEESTKNPEDIRALGGTIC
ncbi:pyroglutamyl-peptidase I [Deinococcus cellulosilyticus]|uniref:Pyrrolidone-carboxylate peptidase n=1 Tax=Deinococcus cellulosilyticus (strain DSM 18568 / NBRC 106333 / KACC 11606 / 5516J-15) TaxID=1223518 RepID=A0A511MXZ6_DEIC1|nr:pyroglutamyl-peptidase I [Deinococcus cellulosilyticus]GEM45158.1 pyrrolidone-carboxylate peptidase [Deinococcus cellulosilyticus NBRC 106333 = KACC 11606]